MNILDSQLFVPQIWFCQYLRDHSYAISDVDHDVASCVHVVLEYVSGVASPSVIITLIPESMLTPNIEERPSPVTASNIRSFNPILRQLLRLIWNKAWSEVDTDLMKRKAAQTVSSSLC